MKNRTEKVDSSQTITKRDNAVARIVQTKILSPGAIISMIVCLVVVAGLVFAAFYCIEEGHIGDYELSVAMPFIILLMLSFIAIDVAAISATLDSLKEAILKTQVEMTHNSYRTMLLTEQILLELQKEENKQLKEGLQSKATAKLSENADAVKRISSMPRASQAAEAAKAPQSPLKSTKRIPVRISKDSNGMIVCPVCKTKQAGNTYHCIGCNQMFANGQPNIPYWCGSCGKEFSHIG